MAKESTSKRHSSVNGQTISHINRSFKGIVHNEDFSTYGEVGSFIHANFNAWNLGFVFAIFTLFFSVLALSVINLQVVNGAELSSQSENNFTTQRYIYPSRGVIYDRNGIKLAENIPAFNLYLDVSSLLTQENNIDESKVRELLTRVTPNIGSKWEELDNDGNLKYKSLEEKVFAKLQEKDSSNTLLIAEGLDNASAIKIKSSEILGEALYLDNGTKRHYPEKDQFSHIIGYTGGVNKEELDQLDYLGLNDVVGKYGVESVYDEALIGQKGMKEQEYDVYGNELLSDPRILEQAVEGKNLYLSIDAEAQKKMYELLQKGVSDFGATGGVGIVQDSNTGEILVLANFPSYDNNKFIGGISQGDYKLLLEDPAYPLLNRSIAAQLPPGSTFKTLTAAGALDAGAISPSTIYTSRRSYTFSNGATFQEYNNNEYGNLNVVGALGKSSNQFFCETIRGWDIDSYIKYLENFGIGQFTGIDLIGESAGMLPSPANKIALAKTSSPWLDPIWYPEGDACNTVIGQGITTVTPLQMVNWTSAIANGGTLNTPHVAKSFINSEGKTEDLKFDPIRKDFISDEKALSVVREGMRNAVTSRVIGALADAKVPVGAKTGTAEFGRLNEKGRYEHNHAWVTGFFPYESPKYTFTLLLEDGGQSYYTAEVARDFINWWVESGR